MTRSKRIRQVTPITELATRCSFCGRPHSEAATVIAGPGVNICDTCVSLCHQVCGECEEPRPAGGEQEQVGGESEEPIGGEPDGGVGWEPARRVRRVHLGPYADADEWISGMSDDDLLAVLPRQARTVEQAERDLRAWVRILRDRDVTWAKIGEALGISRQAAWDRFAADIDAP
ncbi:hypothetical protein Skr01_02280 [Sphaerisporangium krabiense]|uniref:ClpX-type ZB domain-containing protein n=1 Tax=Sphaerisporangium krabiense TaxID=763782 RepID=A0A7W9DRU8_9ACTN|nr:ClpX C4-type zinc finger protein [Sphaerisporangium krabiense]MBB5629017.1 hypothetical protein [Sphaerisporangium krabiense]GII60143.1 hypothetical protein Skr01_02280 [Sphaerisporangium krabiense]